MSNLVRDNPETACQPDGAHHPHMWVCDDPDCDGEGMPCELAYEGILICCVCGGDWPCKTKRQHMAERKADT